jgi:hypothetical protein
MDLQGIPKRAWRARLIEAYQYQSGNEKLPSNRHFFTLGGPCTKPYSEFDYLVHRRKFLLPKQYVSVEGRNKAVHQHNLQIKGATWLWGEFVDQLINWYRVQPSTQKAGIINADLMCGITVAIDIIRTVFAIHEVHNADKCLIAFNLVAYNRWRENLGRHFDPVWETFKHDRYIGRYAKYLIDRFQYTNKTIGAGSHMSMMETLIFWM